jgi:Ca2+-dependent lipid-binding protein
VKNVAAMDSNGKSDPYIKVLFDGVEKGKTKKVKNALNAEYNEGIIIKIKIKI